MLRMTPTEMAQALGSGLLSFPVTHFRPGDLSFDEGAVRAGDTGGLTSAINVWNSSGLEIIDSNKALTQ